MRPADGMADYCSHCDQQVPDGPDLCLGLLPNVAEACCGHGWSVPPYLLFTGGERLDARAAIRWFDAAGVGPPPVDTVHERLFDQYDGRVGVTSEYEYDSLRLVAVRWTNDADVEPVWAFGDIVVRLTRGSGVVPLPPGLVYAENPDGTVTSPIGAIETMPDGG